MINQFTNSPVQNQSFIWIAHYYDNTFLSEFNYDNHQENDFYLIDKTKLIRFGLVGYSMNLYFEVLGGTFKIAGQMFDFSYKVEGKEYHLTSQPMTMYNDIITYKDAEATLDMRDGSMSASTINQYNFGYKQSLNLDDVNFNFKPIFSLPYGNPSFMTLRLVADKDMNGKLCFKKNGLTFEEIDAPMQANSAYELRWEVQI